MATSSYTAEFGAGVVVNGLDLNTDATKVLVGGRKGNALVLIFFLLGPFYGAIAVPSITRCRCCCCCCCGHRCTGGVRQWQHVTVATFGEWQCKIRTGGVRRLAVANGPNIFQMLLVYRSVFVNAAACPILQCISIAGVSGVNVSAHLSICISLLLCCKFRNNKVIIKQSLLNGSPEKP